VNIPLRIGTRASKLAQTQSRHMQARVAAALGAPPEAAEEVAPLVFITTTGDRVQDRRLLEIGGKQLFTKEIEEALLDGRVDLAVHSMKDVPAVQPEGLCIGAIPEREDPRDAFVSRTCATLAKLPEGARLGTASLRRQAQCLALRPDLEIVMLRGNVDTRLRKLDEGECDAILLALAGLRRLGMESVVAERLDPVASPPAPGQGALALQCRSGDPVEQFLQGLHHAETAVAVAAERGALEALEGSCRTAIGAHARIEGDFLSLIVEALTPDGRSRWRREGRTRLGAQAEADARGLGLALGLDVKAEAGDRLVGI
jgi:hydroxymethylbilane synthase